MDKIIYIFSATIFAIFNAYSGAFQSATLYWGRLLAGLSTKEDTKDPELKGKLIAESVGNSGLQGGLTTRSHKMRQNISIILIIVFLVSGFIFFRWYMPFIILFGVLILSFIIQGQLPKPNSEFFKKKIIQELDSQSVYYDKRGENLKKEASNHFINKLLDYEK
jgi:hypothetical protein